MSQFIVIEGLEGAGKSTVQRHVVAWLEARGLSVMSTREPGGTPLAEKMRTLVKELTTSPPAQNAFSPAPLRTTNAMLSSLSHCCSCGSSKLIISKFNAFNDLGALSVAKPMSRPLSVVAVSNTTAASAEFKRVSSVISHSPK